MSDYTPTGNPATDADGVSADMRAEFALIQTAIATKIEANDALGTPTSLTLTNATGLPTAGMVDEAVTYAKMQHVSATDKLLGRSTAGAGDVEEIACTAAGRALIDDADAAAQRETLGAAALAGSATQVFNVEAATADEHAVSRVFGDARYAALAGSASQAFSVAAATTADHAVRADSVVGGFKNKIIGGDFTTNPWQRGTSGFAGGYSADRFTMGNVTDAVVAVLKTADAPTATQAGVFTQHCYHVDVTTADASIGASQSCLVTQHIEGLNAASFGFGQAGTRYVTLSFWHKHTKTGVYCVCLVNSAANRNYVAEYTQDITDTWELATITIPVDTSGTWLYDTGIGVSLQFALAAGTDFHVAANTWGTAGRATANQVNALDNVANNFKLALIQLEVGSIATAFETRSVGAESALCQRYLPVHEFTGAGPFGQARSATTCSMQIPFAVKSRVAPTGLTIIDGAGAFLVTQANGTSITTTDPTFNTGSRDGAKVDGTGSGLVGGSATQLHNSGVGKIGFTGCEL